MDKMKKRILSALKKVISDSPMPMPELPNLPDLTDKMVDLVCRMEYHMQATDVLKTPEFKWRPAYQRSLFFHKRKKEHAIRDFEKYFPNVDPDIIYNEYSENFDEWVKDNLKLGSEPAGVLEVKDLL